MIAFEGLNVAACTTHEIHLTPGTSSCQRSNQTFHEGKHRKSRPRMSLWARLLMTSPQQSTGRSKQHRLPKHVEMLLEFEDSLAIFIKQENGILFPWILPRKHGCKQVAATNFQPPRDRRHLSYWHCENLQGMPFAKFLAHVHHSGANIALWPRSPPSLQWQVHGSTSESWVTKYGTHWHENTKQNNKNKMISQKCRGGVGSKNQIWLNPSPNPSTSSPFVAYQCINMYQPHQPGHVILDSHNSPKESRLTIVSWQLSRPNSFTSAKLYEIPEIWGRS